MKKKIFLLILLCSIPFKLFCTDSILVEIGKIKITADEFIYRYELMPQPYSPDVNLEEKKRNFLYSLIAEKLWALEAEKAGLDTSEIMRAQYNTVEKMYVRDALYQIEIKNKIHISDIEIQTVAVQALTKLHLKSVESASSELIDQVYQSLKSGAQLDSIARQLIIKVNRIEVTFGRLLPVYEDIIYDLNEGEFTPPINTENGSIIFQLIKKERLPSPGTQQLLQKVEEQIRMRKEDSLYNDFMNSIFLSKEVSASGMIIKKLAQLMFEIFKEKEVNSADTLFTLNEKDITKLRKKLGFQLLNAEFINLEPDPLTTNEYLDYLQFKTISVKNVERNTILFVLNSHIKNIIELEVLAAEAYRRGLQNLPDVKKDLKMWRESYLAKILQQQKVDSSIVTDEEVKNYLESKGNKKSIDQKIIYIKSDDLNIMNDVLDKIKSGIDFAELAEKYSSTNEQFPIDEEIQRIAIHMKEDEIYGPVKSGNEYVIIQKINEDAVKDSTNKSDKVFEDVRRSLSYKKLRENFIDYTVSLADKYGIKINEDLYRSIQLNDWKVIAFRYMGFGGVINAVPYVFPFYEWSDSLQQDKTIP